jgi:hypothetical protein
MCNEFWQGNLLKSVCLEERYMDHDNTTVELGERGCEDRRIEDFYSKYYQKPLTYKGNKY